jgi:LPXTG-site transpeptidase (sortase) family protein
MKTVKVVQLTSLALIVTGLAGIAPIVYFRYKLAMASPVPVIPVKVPTAAIVQKPDAVTGYPVKVTIASLNIDVAIVPGTYNEHTKQWDLGLHTAHFATMTTQPNDQAGNTYIYGHYRPEVFAYLHNAKAGTEAVITTDNGYQFSYTLKESKTIDPTDTSVFAYDGPPIMTLQTCTGTFFQNRQQFTFTYNGYKKL